MVKCQGRAPGTCEQVVEQKSPARCHYHVKVEAGLITPIPKSSRWYLGRSGLPVDIPPASTKTGSGVSVDY
jgi:hypothetical protein